MARLGAITDDLKRVLEPIIDDGEDAVQDTVRRGEDVVTGGSSRAVEQILRSSEFAAVIDAVEAKAEAGATKAAGKNALALGGIAVAAAAVGSRLLKGPVGLTVAVTLGAWGFATILTSAQAAKRAK